MTTAETWGHIYAVIERVSADGQLKAAQITLAAATPGALFGEHYARIQRRLPAWADLRLRDLLDNIDPADMDARLGLEEQGKFLLGLYHERTRLEDEEARVLGGRPAKDSTQAVDWSDVDWGHMSDRQIAEKKGVSRQTANAQRKRHEPKTPAL
jgi:hypothetical protein